MVDEVLSIVDEIQQQCAKDPLFPEEPKMRVAMYLEIVKETMDNQHKIIDSYEGITKRLEAQITESQSALEDSTRREMEQLQMIMELKEQYDELGTGSAIAESEDCEACEGYEEENALLREQAEQQGLVIEKLSKA